MTVRPETWQNMQGETWTINMDGERLLMAVALMIMGADLGRTVQNRLPPFHFATPRQESGAVACQASLVFFLYHTHSLLPRPCYC